MTDMIACAREHPVSLRFNLQLLNDQRLLLHSHLLRPSLSKPIIPDVFEDYLS